MNQNEDAIVDRLKYYEAIIESKQKSIGQVEEEIQWEFEGTATTKKLTQDETDERIRQKKERMNMLLGEKQDGEDHKKLILEELEKRRREQ